ncbi:MAG: hypothetical protein J6C44_08360 [Muribaculaceae bacterium]|nr:hypothetical protein [Muribaculaceae bacterium]
MKKVLLTMVAALGLFVVACSSPAEKAVDVYKDATEKVKEAKNLADITTVTAEVEKEIADLKLTDEDLDNKELKAAEKAFSDAAQDKTTELGREALGL